MARNVESKVRCPDLDRARVVVRDLGGHHESTTTQVDRYHEIEAGRRVKVRTFGDGRPPELIRYDRPEIAGVRTSLYTIERDPFALPGGEPLVVVRKEREVWILENVRVHLDRVEGLGTFLELEAVVDTEHDERVCERQVATILSALGVSAASCLPVSYADLLLERSA